MWEMWSGLRTTPSSKSLTRCHGFIDLEYVNKTIIGVCARQHISTSNDAAIGNTEMGPQKRVALKHDWTCNHNLRNMVLRLRGSKLNLKQIDQYMSDECKTLVKPDFLAPLPEFGPQYEIPEFGHPLHWNAAKNYSFTENENLSMIHDDILNWKFVL